MSTPPTSKWLSQPVEPRESTEAIVAGCTPRATWNERRATDGLFRERSITPDDRNGWAGATTDAPAGLGTALPARNRDEWRESCTYTTFRGRHFVATFRSI